MYTALDVDHFECLLSICDSYTQSPIKNINVVINAKMQPVEYRVDFFDMAYAIVPFAVVHDLAYETGKTTHARVMAEVEYVPLSRQQKCTEPPHVPDNY